MRKLVVLLSIESICLDKDKVDYFYFVFVYVNIEIESK